MENKRPKCLQCQYYFTTFDPARPRGCRKYGFQSTQFPSILVKKETGEDCMAFKQKEHFKKNKGVDLNDDSLW